MVQRPSTNLFWGSGFSRRLASILLVRNVILSLNLPTCLTFVIRLNGSGEMVPLC